MANDPENNQSYSANPNQKVYDTPHQIDHLVDVVDIYFAEERKKFKWVQKEETYTVKKGGKIADVKNIYTKKFADEKKNARNVTTDPDHANPLNPNDQIKITWEEREEDGVELVKISKIHYAKKVYVVAKCNGQSGKLTIEINENRLAHPEAVFDIPVKFLIGEDEKTKIEFKISRDKTEYSQEITLKPKSDEDHKKIAANFDKRNEKKAHLFFKADVTETQDEVKFPDATKEFLNQETTRFQVSYCGCAEYVIVNGFLSGPSVITTKAGSLVSGHNGIQDVIAIILHRTAGSSTAGAVAHTKGTHFYVDKGANDGEIFQAVSLDKYTNHIMNSTARTNNMEIQTENSVGIEVVGMAYYYKNGDLYNVYDTKISNPANFSLSAGYKGSDGKEFFWDALTENQIKSLKCLLVKLMEHYNLTKEDIYSHEAIQSKTAGEGATVKDAIMPKLDCL